MERFDKKLYKPNEFHLSHSVVIYVSLKFAFSGKKNESTPK